MEDAHPNSCVALPVAAAAVAVGHGCVFVKAAAAQKGQEVRELNHMLKAWEAMRLGKDAQVGGGAGEGQCARPC